MNYLSVKKIGINKDSLKLQFDLPNNTVKKIGYKLANELQNNLKIENSEITIFIKLI